MTDTLLRSLRDRLLDESEPLAGLLRTCLLLGAETGSESLRQWARHELNGYAEGSDLPVYRKLPTPPISVNSISGYTRVENQTFHRAQLSASARKGIPEHFPLYQPIEELQELASRKSVSFTGEGLAHAQTVWNGELGDFQQITGMSFTLSGAAFAGVLGQIRTHLVDVVADLTAGTPFAELPRKAQVDAAVSHHIGTQYVTTIHTAHGPTAIGAQAEAKSEGLSIDDAIRLIDALRAQFDALDDQQARDELTAAVEDLRAEAQSAVPDTGAVVRKAGKLQSLAAKLGVPALSAAVGGAVEVFTALALGGAFG